MTPQKIDDFEIFMEDIDICTITGRRNKNR